MTKCFPQIRPEGEQEARRTGHSPRNKVRIRPHTTADGSEPRLHVLYILSLHYVLHGVRLEIITSNFLTKIRTSLKIQQLMSS